MELELPSLSTRAEGQGGLPPGFPAERPVLVLPLPILLLLVLILLNPQVVLLALPIVPPFGVLRPAGSGLPNGGLLVGYLPPLTIQMFCWQHCLYLL